MRPRSTTHRIFGALVAVEVIVAVAFAAYGGGLLSFMLSWFVIGTIIAWIVQVTIDRKVAKQPVRPLTPEQLRRHNIGRVVVAIALVAMAIIALKP